MKNTNWGYKKKEMLLFWLLSIITYKDVLRMNILSKK